MTFFLRLPVSFQAKTPNQWKAQTMKHGVWEKCLLKGSHQHKKKKPQPHIQMFNWKAQTSRWYEWTAKVDLEINGSSLSMWHRCAFTVLRSRRGEDLDCDTWPQWLWAASRSSRIMLGPSKPWRLEIKEGIVCFLISGIRWFLIDNLVKNTFTTIIIQY